MNYELIRQIEKSDIFKTLKHTKNYLSADIAIKAMAFISIPIFTRLFTQADYGVVSVFSAYVGIFAVILSLNSYTAVSRYYYEKTDDFGEFIGTALFFVSLIFVSTVPIYILFYKQISGLIKLPGLLPIYLIFACLFVVIYSIYYQILVPQKKSKEAATISILKGYATFGVAVLFVYLLRENRYLGKIWANLLVGLILSVYFIIKIGKYLKFSFKIEHIKYIANYSFPLIPYALSGIILAQFDRIMINNIIDTASAGLYSLGYNVGMLLLIVIGSIQTALVPDFFKFLDNKEYNRLDRLIKRVFSIITVAALGLILFAREIVVILADKKFHPGLSVVPLIVIGYVFFAMFTVYGRYIGYKKRTVFSSLVTLTAGISNIILNAIFIPIYGYIAGAYTTVASYFLLFLFSWIVASFILKVRITPLGILWKPTGIMFFFIGIFFLISKYELSFIIMFFVKIVILVFFVVLVFNKEIKRVYDELIMKEKHR